MKKRLMSLALSVTVLLGIAPIGSVVSYADTLKYDLWVNSERMTSTTLSVKCGSGTAVFDPDDNVLTLTNAQISLGSSESGSKSGILSQLPDLKIELKGTNTIQNTGGCSILASSVSSPNSPCAVSFSGNGSLTVKDTSSNGGIQCTGKIDISGTTLNVDSTGPAILSNNEIAIKNSNVTASAGGSSNVISSQNGKVSISGSTVSVTCTSGSGIYLGSNQSGSSLTIKDSAFTDSASQGIKGATADSCSVTFENSTATINTGAITTMIPESNITLKSCYISSGSFSGSLCEISNKPLAISVSGGHAYITGKYGTAITEAMPGNSITVVPDAVSGKYVSKWSASNLTFDQNSILAEFRMPTNSVSLKPVYSNQTSTKVVFDDDRTVVGEDIFLSLVNMYGEPATDTDSLVHIDLDGDGTNDLYGYRSDFSLEIQPSSSVTANTYNANKSTVGKYSPITLQLVSHIHTLEYRKYKEATCAEIGNIGYYECTECYKQFLDEDGTMLVEDESQLVIPKNNNHVSGKSVDENVVNPTCTKDGSKDVVTYCTVCSKELSRTHVDIPATGHTWSDWTVVKEATESAEGKESRTCSTCKEKEERTIPKLNHVHKPSYVEPVASTCTEQGSQGYYKCSGCQRMFSDKDCTKEISDLSTLKLPKAEHEWDGKDESENRVEPTCTTAGSEMKVKHCKHCGAEINRESVTINALGHSWGDWVTITPAGEKTSGQEKHTCDTCGYVEQRTIPATGHIHDMIHFPQKDPTCSADGTKEYYQCRDCKRQYFDEAGTQPVNSSFDLLIYPLYHDFDLTKPVIENKVEATADKDGSYDEVVYCNRCKQEMKRTTIVIPRIGGDGGDDYKDDLYTVFIGDADLSGNIDIEDVVLIMQHINGIKPLPTQNFYVADVNLDKAVTIEDVVMIVSHINGVKPLADIKTSSKASK